MTIYDEPTIYFRINHVHDALAPLDGVSSLTLTFHISRARAVWETHHVM